MTATYVGKIREVRFLAPDVAVLRAVAGMIPPGTSDLNPDANAVQTLVVVRRDDRWRIALYHNTPAAFHGRTEASEAAIVGALLAAPFSQAGRSCRQPGAASSAPTTERRFQTSLATYLAP